MTSIPCFRIKAYLENGAPCVAKAFIDLGRAMSHFTVSVSGMAYQGLLNKGLTAKGGQQVSINLLSFLAVWAVEALDLQEALQEACRHCTAGSRLFPH